ncbi:hypothetical protein KXD98_25185 [Mycobacterium sp. SMC-4]|nr:hypothetical protein KXD98_25185 [Mycobacterium sp. SMC-4]
MNATLIIAATALVLAGCGGTDAPEATSPAASPPVATEQTGTAEQQPDQVVLDVTIEAGTVTPTNEQLQAAVGQPIVVNIDSDVVDELHVHSTPEHTFAVAPEPGQTFEFTVEMPGRVDVELHETHTTIATILVR